MAQIFDIAQLVRNELPAGFVVADDYITMNTKIQQSLLATPANILDADKYDQTKWPDNWNILISYLIVYGIFQTALLGGVLLNSGLANNGSINKGQVKKIVTGPTEVEWQDTAAAFSTLIKNLTIDPNSIFNVLISNACTMSRILGIKIPFCKGLQIGAMFVKAGQCYDPIQYRDLLTYEVVTSNQTIIL